MTTIEANQIPSRAFREPLAERLSNIEQECRILRRDARLSLGRLALRLRHPEYRKEVKAVVEDVVYAVEQVPTDINKHILPPRSLTAEAETIYETRTNAQMLAYDVAKILNTQGIPAAPYEAVFDDPDEARTQLDYFSGVYIINDK